MRLAATVAAALLSGCCYIPAPPDPGPPPASPFPAPVGGPIADLDPTYVASFCHSPGLGCPLLAEAAVAGPFAGCPVPADYLGVMYPLGGEGDGLEVPFFFQVRPGAVGCTGSGRVLVLESPEETADVTAVLASLRAGVAPPAGSGAVAYVHSASPPSGYHPIEATRGVSSVLLGPNTVYLRSAGTRVIFLGSGDIRFDRPPIMTSYMVGQLWRLP